MKRENENQEGSYSLDKLRRQFSYYSTAKSQEIDECRLAHRYYSGSQYSAAELKALAARNQPAITFNRISRKIDGVVGTVRKLRTDPKAFPRTEGQDDAAELATQVVRYVCDASQFENIESETLLSAAIYGYAFCELSLSGEDGNYDVGLIDGDSRTFFYDPRSVKADFSDARFMGTYKFVTSEELEDITPDGSDEIGEQEDATFSTQFETDREDNWIDDRKRVKLVDHWYIHKGKWHWCLHVGTKRIASGESPFFDDNGKSLCKFMAFSAYIDQDGDRYSFFRNMRGPQDAMNQHRAKSVWLMNSRQIVVRRGALENVEETRTQLMNPNGIMLYDGDSADFRIVEPNQEFIQQTQYYQDAKDEIENFGPNPALLGTGVNAASGRAMAMMQQSGLSELGPFLNNYRHWKLSIYKAIWGACKRYWTAERWLRITGDEKAAQFVKINETRIDEYGMPFIVNQLGQIDVDIVMDEGPDTENVMGDVFDTIQALAQNGAVVPPQVLIEMSPLPSSVKDKLVKMMQPQPDQQQAEQAALQIKMAQEQAKAEKTQAEAHKVTTDAWINEQRLGMNIQGAVQGGAVEQGMPEQQASPTPYQQPAPAPPPVAIHFDAQGAMQGAADTLQGMAAQNTEFMGQAAQSIAQSAEMMSQAVQMLAQTSESTSQATMAIASAVDRMNTPKRIVRDPVTGRASHTEAMV